MRKCIQKFKIKLKGETTVNILRERERDRKTQADYKILEADTKVCATS